MKLIMTDGEIAAMERRLLAHALVKAAADYKITEEAKRIAFNREKAEYEALQEARDQCAVCFNFNAPGVTVVSVERVNHNTLDEKTIVGYYINGVEPTISAYKDLPSCGPDGPHSTGTIQNIALGHHNSAIGGIPTLGGSPEPAAPGRRKFEEWGFKCSRGQHNRLVAQFQEARGIYKGQENTDTKQLLKG